MIVLGDARTNGRDPRADIFATIAARAGRTFWLNPEPRLYWNYGDSVIDAYARYCTAFECWTTRQLEDFVKALTRAGRAPAERPARAWRATTMRAVRCASPGAQQARRAASPRLSCLPLVPPGAARCTPA